MTLVLFGHDLSGTTAQRPTNADVGQFYYNTTLGQMQVCVGANVWTATQGIGAAGGAGSVVSLVTKKLAIADNTATSLITITVPNANHAAAIRLTMLATMGVGTDAFESSRVATGTLVLARTTGAAVVAAVSTIAQAQIATVDSGGTLTLAYGVSAVTGAVGAVNTIDLQVTLVKTGTLTNHQCVVLAELINAEASGVTMAAAA